jgi:hypothetical protein
MAAMISLGQYGFGIDDYSPLEGFDFGRDKNSLKRQRLFFRDRLPSNNMQTNGRESLQAMRKKGSFLFREYSVPNQE